MELTPEAEPSLPYMPLTLTDVFRDPDMPVTADGVVVCTDVVVLAGDEVVSVAVDGEVGGAVVAETVGELVEDDDVDEADVTDGAELVGMSPEVGGVWSTESASALTFEPGRRVG